MCGLKKTMACSDSNAALGKVSFFVGLFFYFFILYFIFFLSVSFLQFMESERVVAAAVMSANLPRI